MAAMLFLTTLSAMLVLGAASSPVLSAFFGDALLPSTAFALCPPPSLAGGYGGMPIVFSEAIDPQGGYAGQPFGIDPNTFRVEVLGKGFVTPTCATLSPATSPGEQRTVLLAGEFGDGTAALPLLIDIMRPLRTMENRTIDRLRIDDILPLNGGASLVLAERFAVTDGNVSTSVDDDSAFCPRNGTSVVIKLTFSGGVTALNGGSLQDDVNAMAAIQIMARFGNGTRVVVNPFALRDIHGDNHLDACLDDKALTVNLERVAVNGNVFYSPSNIASPSGMLPIS